MRHDEALIEVERAAKGAFRLVRPLANALRLAATLPADAALPEGDGLTAAELSGAARQCAMTKPLSR
jgi:hypothetical protein